MIAVVDAESVEQRRRGCERGEHLAVVGQDLLGHAVLTSGRVSATRTGRRLPAANTLAEVTFLEWLDTTHETATGRTSVKPPTSRWMKPPPVRL